MIAFALPGHLDVLEGGASAEGFLDRLLGTNCFSAAVGELTADCRRMEQAAKTRLALRYADQQQRCSATWRLLPPLAESMLPMDRQTLPTTNILQLHCPHVALQADKLPAGNTGRADIPLRFSAEPAGMHPGVARPSVCAVC